MDLAIRVELFEPDAREEQDTIIKSTKIDFQDLPGRRIPQEILDLFETAAALIRAAGECEEYAL